jgi:Fe-S oxidoreductase
MDSWQTPERTAEDKGLQARIDALTPERIEKVINEVIAAEWGGRLKTYLDGCVRCGLCAWGCHQCVSHNLDPTYSPVGKVHQTLRAMIEKKGKVSPQFMERAVRIAHTECNLCKRCAMFCPLGIDTSYLMLVVRRICHKLAITPPYIQDTVHSHSVTANQMWVKEDEWIDTLQWQEEELRDEFPKARIPIEKEGADCMYSVIGPEPKFQPQLIYQAAAIMNTAGIDWTLPETPGWDNSDMAMFTRDDELVARIKRQHFETAMRLKVKRIVMGECGHAFRSIYDVGNRLLGWKMHPIPVVHAIQFYWELLRDGKIKVAKKYDKPVTLHDPCNIIRGRGLHNKLRELAHAFCSDIREMYPNKEQNYCCCAGGGVINCGPPYKLNRTKGNKVKAEQIKETEAEVVLAPCHNCHSGLEDIVDYYQLGVHIHFLGDIIYQCMEKPTAIDEG